MGEPFALRVAAIRGVCRGRGAGVQRCRGAEVQRRTVAMGRTCSAATPQPTLTQ